MIPLRDMPGISEISRLARGEGEWLSEAELQERVDWVSISLFGITEADTIRTPLDAKTVMGDERHFDRARHGAAIDASERECAAWEEGFQLARLIAANPRGFLAIGELDITGEDGDTLPIVARFVRQICACVGGTVDGAKFTPDGSGRKAVIDAETWGAGLARDALQFQSRRRV